MSIFDNIITNNDNGITDYVGNNTHIYNNSISHNSFSGILVYSSAAKDCDIHNNIIFNNGIGIHLESNLPAVIKYNIIRGNSNGIVSDSNNPSIISQNNFIGNTRQAYFTRDFMILARFFYPSLFFPKQKWNNNYWDDWKVKFPRPIRGETRIEFPPPFLIFELDLNSFEFDWHPAKKPYDIPG